MTLADFARIWDEQQEQRYRSYETSTIAPFCADTMLASYGNQARGFLTAAWRQRRADPGKARWLRQQGRYARQLERALRQSAIERELAAMAEAAKGEAGKQQERAA